MIGPSLIISPFALIFIHYCFATTEPQVEDVTWTDSYGLVSSDVDKWTSKGLSGGTVTFLIMLAITALLGILCFIYYKKNGR